MVDPLGPRYIGPSHGINKVVPSKDRESKKKKPGEDARRKDDDDEEFVRKGRRIDDRA
jgi:hypothetical protein